MLFIITLINLICKVASLKRGALVTLVKGESHGDFYLLVRRNKSILQFFWNKNITTIDGRNTSSNPDIVLFYETSLTENLREYIQQQTPEIPIKFIPVKFDGFGEYKNASDKGSGFKQVYEKCHGTRWSEAAKLGYKNMCRFWFIGFLDYLREYDWMLRLDPDCEFEEESRDIIPFEGNIFISSPAWLPLHNQRFDKISTTYDGEVVRGMGPFVREFVEAVNGGKAVQIDSWHAPYTNAMFMNLSMLYANDTNDMKLIWKFLHAVDASNCIYSNRWLSFHLFSYIFDFKLCFPAD